MNNHRNFNLLDALHERAISGAAHRPSAWLSNETQDYLVTKVRYQYQNAKKAFHHRETYEYASQLRFLALTTNSAAALAPFITRSNYDVFGEAGLNKLSVWLHGCAYLPGLSAFRNLDSDKNINLVFSRLISAAESARGRVAIDAAIMLAKLYAYELGFYIDPHQQQDAYSLSWHYQIMCTRVLDPKNKKAEMAVTISAAGAYAEMGSRDALTELIRWYQKGDKELGLEPDEAEAEKWQIELDELHENLKKKFDHCFYLAINGIITQGYISENNDELIRLYLIIHDKPSTIKDARNFFLDHLDKNINTIPDAMFFRAKSFDHGTHHPINAASAKLWYGVALNSKNCSPGNAAIAARRLYDLYNENDGVSREALLKKADELGCPKSAYDYGARALKNKKMNEALRYFSCALDRDCDDYTAQSIMNDLGYKKPFEALEIMKVFFKATLHLARKGNNRGIVRIIDTLADEDKQLEAAWTQLNTQVIERYPVNVAAVNALIEETQQTFLRYLQPKRRKIDGDMSETLTFKF